MSVISKLFGLSWDRDSSKGCSDFQEAFDLKSKINVIFLAKKIGLG